MENASQGLANNASLHRQKQEEGKCGKLEHLPSAVFAVAFLPAREQLRNQRHFLLLYVPA